jgi:predicted nucleic acid-binding protein
MSDKFFVDTNILMYAHDTSAGKKHERAKALVEELWRNRSGVLSTQVLQATREIVTDYLAWQIVVNSGESTLEALDLEARYQISFWDALVLHAANAAGADVLYSEDLSDGQTYGAVRVVNPVGANT